MGVPNKNIGVLDLNIDNIYFLNALKDRFKNDNIHYINDMSIDNVDELSADDINKSINNVINYLMSKKIDVLVVVSDSVVEFCEEQLNSLSIPVINIVNESINYVNEQYEYKNFGFLSTTSMIEANIYQKNLKYNHLYSMYGDDLKILIRNQLVKTTESFQEVKNVIASIYKKDVDVIIPSLMNFLTVYTEIFEYIKDIDILPVDKILCDAVEKVLYNGQALPIKGNGKVNIYYNQEIDSKMIDRIVKVDYKLVAMTKEEK